MTTNNPSNKYLTADVAAAIEAVKTFEEVDERFERLKLIWAAGLKEKIADGMSHKKAYDLVGKAVAGGRKMEFPTFAKLLSRLAMRGKKKKSDAQKSAEGAAKTQVATAAATRNARRAAAKVKSSSENPAPTPTVGDALGDPFSNT